MPFVLRLVAYEHKHRLKVLPDDLHMLLDGSSISVQTTSTRLVEAVCLVWHRKTKLLKFSRFFRMSVLRLFTFTFDQVIIVAIAMRE